MKRNVQNTKFQTSNTSNGITLVALVITIIILLILAGVGINMAINSDGLFGKANEATEKWNTAVSKEETILSNLYSELSGELKNDDLPGNEHLKTFITEWTVDAGDTIILPIHEKQDANVEENGESEIYFNYDFSVDYGDGTIAQITSFDDGDRTHTYEKAGTYEVKITGICESWGFRYVPDSVDKITQIEQWGVLQAKHIDFKDCINLKGEIPVPSLNSFNEVVSFRTLFMNCSELTGTIPENLFNNAIKVVTIRNAFQGARGLTGTISENLLANCTELTHAQYLFASCRGLTGNISGNLLKNCIKLEYANAMFGYCTGLSGNIPGDLFKTCTELKGAGYLFQEANNLTGNIPADLFANCPKLNNMYSTFENCTGLSGAIPENLLISDKLTTIKYCFRGCTGITDSNVKLGSIALGDANVAGAFSGLEANITVQIPKGGPITTSANFSTTANVTITEYEV